jgi:virginiamycin B lyase
VAVAADGAVWATLQAANQLLRIGPDGTIRALNLPRPAAVPTDIAVAPDGAVWFVQFRGNIIEAGRELYPE